METINKILFIQKLNSILKKSYSEMSIENLKSLLIDTELLFPEALEFHEGAKAEYESNYESNIAKKSLYDKLVEEKSCIIEDSYNGLSPIRKFFTISPKNRQFAIYPHLNNNDKNRINQIDEEIKSLKKYLNFDGQLPSSPDGSNIFSIKNRIKKLKTLIRKKERSESEKAMVISAKAKTRRVGIEIIKTLKEQIAKFPDCPYCFKPLGVNPHCDHIHPVTHGGLSTLYNMVYICSPCNLKKKDLTLREFLIEYGLNRDKVERNLLIMGKRL